NTVSRPGPLTTEWWTVLIAGAVSSVLAVVGLPGSAASQVAGIVAPIVIALVYAFTRSRTKGALADALKAIFPQAGAPVAGDAAAAPGAPGADVALPVAMAAAHRGPPVVSGTEPLAAPVDGRN